MQTKTCLHRIILSHLYTAVPIGGFVVGLSSRHRRTASVPNQVAARRRMCMPYARRYTAAASSTPNDTYMAP